MTKTIDYQHAFAFGVLLLAFMGLLALVPGLEFLGRVRSGYIPMAPATAVCFIALTFALLRADISHPAPVYIVLALFVAVLGLLVFTGELIGYDLSIESSILPDLGTLDGKPLGRMSPATGATFLVAGLAFVTASPTVRRLLPQRLSPHAGGLAFAVVFFSGDLFLLGYLFGIPLMYDLGNTVPVAFTTAAGFILLGISGVIAAGPSAYPSKLFTGNSTKAALMRAFVPLTVASALVVCFVLIYELLFSIGNPALDAALVIAVTVGATGLVAARVAGRIGDRLDTEHHHLSEISRNLSVTLNSIGDAVLSVNLAGEIVGMNPMAEQMTGVLFREALGRPLSEIVHLRPAYAARVISRPVRQGTALPRSSGLPNHSILTDAGGSEIRIADSRAPIRTDDGEIIGMVLVMRDITEEIAHTSAIMESEERFRALSENSRDLIFRLDRGRRINYCNPVGLEFSGMPGTAVFGRSISVFGMTDADAAVVDELVAGVIDQGKSRREVFSIVTIRGRMWFDLQLSPEFGGTGEVAHVLGIARDITRLKTAELEMLEKNEELNHFAYAVAHDLKAPVRGVRFLTELLADTVSDGDREQARELLSMVENRIDSMGHLIDDILEYSRLGRQELELETVNFSDLVSEITVDLAVPEGFDVRIEGDIRELRTSRVRLRQVLANLIQNAVLHHHEEQGTILVHGVRNGTFYHIAVEDDGPGIPGQYSEKVFEIFQTLEAGDNPESTGIGLALVKKAVQSVGGRVTLKSESGKGARFEFTWPITFGGIYGDEDIAH